MSRRLSREEKGKTTCYDSLHAPRTARVKAQLPDNSEIDNKFSLTLIGRVTNPSAQKIWPLIAFFTELWKSDVRPTGADLGNGLFQFKFEREADLLQVLEKRPYHFSRWMVIVQRWEPTTSMSFPALIPFWIKVQGIPIHLWSDEIIQNIGEDIGVFEKAEITSASAKMRVHVNGLLPLITSTVIEFSNGDEVRAKLVYERLEKHCSKCFRLDHELKDCLEAKHQNKARLAAQEVESSKQTSHPSVQETHKGREWEPRGNFTFQSSASNVSDTRVKRGPREVRESSNHRTYKSRTREWEERGSQRRTYQARERTRGNRDFDHQPLRDQRHRYPVANGRSYYREISRNESISRELGTKAPGNAAETDEGGTPLYNCPYPLPHDAVEKALGEVRDAMLVYTKSADPTEREARIERMRQAEEKGEIEERALQMVRDSMMADARIPCQDIETSPPERIPATQRLSLSDASQHKSGKSSEGRGQKSDSQERVPATQRLGPPLFLQDSLEEGDFPDIPQPGRERGPVAQRLGPPQEIPPASEDRVPVALRLGPVLENERTKELTLPTAEEKRKPGRPPGRRTVQRSPKLVPGSGSKRRTATQNKPPTARRKLAADQNTTARAKTKTGTSRRKGSTTTSETSSENRPICNMIPASSRKRMDFRTPSIPGP